MTAIVHPWFMTEVEHPPALSSVVLLRLRDFSRRPVAEQARLNAQLDTVLAVLLQDIPAPARVVLAGDGTAAVAVLGNAPLALAFAERALRANRASLGLCIGIEHGPVEISTAAAGDALTGDGLATAKLIAAFAEDVGLLVSTNFYAALAQAVPGAQCMLVPAGIFSDAALRSYQVFRVDQEAPKRRRRHFRLMAIGTMLVLAAATMALRLGVPDRPRPLAPIVDRAASTVLDLVQRGSRGRP